MFSDIKNIYVQSPLKIWLFIMLIRELSNSAGHLKISSTSEMFIGWKDLLKHAKRKEDYNIAEVHGETLLFYSNHFIHNKDWITCLFQAHDAVILFSCCMDYMGIHIPNDTYTLLKQASSSSSCICLARWPLYWITSRGSGTSDFSWSTALQMVRHPPWNEQVHDEPLHLKCIVIHSMCFL